MLRHNNPFKLIIFQRNQMNMNVHDRLFIEYLNKLYNKAGLVFSSDKEFLEYIAQSRLNLIYKAVYDLRRKENETDKEYLLRIIDGNDLTSNGNIIEMILKPITYAYFHSD